MGTSVGMAGGSLAQSLAARGFQHPADHPPRTYTSSRRDRPRRPECRAPRQRAPAQKPGYRDRLQIFSHRHKVQ